MQATDKASSSYAAVMGLREFFKVHTVTNTCGVVVPYIWAPWFSSSNQYGSSEISGNQACRIVGYFVGCDSMLARSAKILCRANHIEKSP